MPAISWHIEKYSNISFYENLPSESQVATRGQTDRQTTMKLTVNFCNLVNMPKRIFTPRTHYTDSSKYIAYLPDTVIKSYI